MEESGAEISRLWVAFEDYSGDLQAFPTCSFKISQSFWAGAMEFLRHYLKSFTLEILAIYRDQN
jgi:hypothetical protein